MPTAESIDRLKDEVIRVPMLIEGDWVYSDTEYDTFDPYRKTLVSKAPESSAQDVDRALASAFAARGKVAAMPAYERARLLRRAHAIMEERTEELATLVARETGKPYKDAVVECTRSRDTIWLSSEEAVRIQGEHVPLDATAAGSGKMAFLMRYPIGVVAGITPYNAPVNLACHKIGPALAAGDPIVLKAPPQCPATIHALVQCFVDAGLPAGFLNVLYGHTAGPLLVRDPRVEFITFTGSTMAGAAIKAASGLRRVALELGGIGATVVHSDANIEEAAVACGRNAMRLAGQSCISVQNVYVHESRYDAFMEALMRDVNNMKLGDPFDPATDIGPVVDEQAAIRIKAVIDDAAAKGARILSGGGRDHALVQPTVLVDVDNSMKAVCEEIFGPVMTVAKYSDVEAVFTEISDRRLGLQSGIFTKSLELAMRAARTLRVGGVIVNGTSSFRTDQLAYGGVKDSGIGREGPKYAIREMTEERLMVFNF